MLLREEFMDLENYQFICSFTFDIDHKREMFTVKSGARGSSFTCYLLSQELSDLQWQQMECPMTFPQCRYDWTTADDTNPLVKMSSISSLLSFYDRLFLCLE